MAKRSNKDLFTSLRTQGLRKSVARTLSDLESTSRTARTRAEKLARQAIKDLRSAADTIEKRVNVGGAGTRSTAAKKAAATRKRTAAKRSAAAKKGAAKRKAAAKKSTATKARKTVKRAVKRATS